MADHVSNPISREGAPTFLSRLRLQPPAGVRPLIRAIGIGSAFVYLTLAGLAPPSAQPAVAQTGAAPLRLSWSSAELAVTESVAWGDYDGDGDLDLAVGNFHQPNRLYRNDGTVNGLPVFNLVWSSNDAGFNLTQSVAWGDYDGDGDLDLAAGNRGLPNRLYRNDNGMLTATGVWTSTTRGLTWSVAWGDADADGDLDLAVGNIDSPNHLYLNEGVTNGLPVFNLAWTAPLTEPTWSVAWGDADGDGDLDLAAGNQGAPNRLYRNEGVTNGLPVFNLVWSATVTEFTQSVAWGDADADGDLDLVAGNAGGPDRLYRNDGVGSDGAPSFSTLSVSDLVDYTWSLAWGDFDADGDLDLIMGNTAEPTRLYRNDGVSNDGVPIFRLAWESALLDDLASVAWGDVDGDGDLDLAVGNLNLQPTRVYLNDSGTLQPSAFWSPLMTDTTTSVAWGDVDGDSDLDLAVGNYERPGRLFRNENGRLTTTAVWTSAVTETTVRVAWGDYDSDGDLDLTVGNLNQLYRNDGVTNDGQPILNPVRTSIDVSGTASVAWGDVDGDGDLDLAVAYTNDQPNRLYRNDGVANNGVPNFSLAWSSDEADDTSSIAWGDLDGDGDLDLAAGNWGQPKRLYRNDGGALTHQAVWSSGDTDRTIAIAWGDVDGDGDLDLALANWRQPNRLYRNDGITDDGDPSFTSAWSSDETDDTSSVAWGDYDGDGDLDLAAGNLSGPNRVYRNDNGKLTTSAAWSSGEIDSTNSIAWGDVDGDGDLDLATGNSNGWNKVYLTQTPAHPFRPRYPAAVSLNLYSDPVTTFSQIVTALAPADFYAVPGIRAGVTIPISYTISDPESGSAWRVRGFFSPDGGGRWFPAIATAQTITRNILSGTEQVYVWDVGASGFFGQSDNVVFRLEALPGGPLPSQRPYVTAHTYPFRVRGTQVRVVDEFGQPVQGALVYRLPAGQASGGQPMGGAMTPFRTSMQGYLSGRGDLRRNDHLVAVWPVTPTEKYVLYHTSARPIATGLETFTVTQAGVQTLTVSSAYPLLLLNLKVSLEWDASNDSLFLEQLRQNLGKTSAALYDWTNGQVALGRVTVSQDKQHWAEADVHIFASNQVRPIANRGGIVTQSTVLSFTRPLTFTTGEVRIGPTWNRYGDPQPLGDDWPNVLAHELGHYALFLEDTYLGLDANGILVPIDTCTGTAMSDPYDVGSSEFRHADSTWPAQCGGTLAELPDWDLMRLAYPALHSPPPANAGPTAMPFAFTRISVEAAPGQARPLLDDSNIALGNAASDLSRGRAYLRHPGESLIDLGRPILDSVLARGAREGDELCVFGDAAFACSSLATNVSRTQFVTRTLWQPEIILTPVSSTTLRILVNAPGSGTLTATLYPNGEAPQVESIAPAVVETITLSQPAVEVMVEITGTGPDQRLITGYATGAGPGRAKDHGGPGRAKDHGAFAASDGSLVIYPPESLPDDVFVVLQTATDLPELPSGLVPIGRAYLIRPSTMVTDFTGASLSFQYLGLEVLLSREPEENLAILYSDGTTWTQLPTTLNLTQNFASAPLPGSGLYALTAGRATPRIMAASPTSGTVSQTHALSIFGQNFLGPVAITLKSQAGVDYPLSVTFIASQTVTALTPITLPADLYDLQLTNAGGLTATLPGAFALYATRPGACFFDDFASGLGNWTRTGEWDIVTVSGQEAATDSPGASYLNAEPGVVTRTTTITSHRFNLAACPDPVLRFRHDYAIAIGPGAFQDWGSMEISADDGKTWQLLAHYTGGVGYSALRAAVDEWNPVAWKRVALNLAELGVPTHTETARLRFSLTTDAVGSDKGWIVDDVLVTSASSIERPWKAHLPFIARKGP